jgi:hypothetical protein
LSSAEKLAVRQHRERRQGERESVLAHKANGIEPHAYLTTLFEKLPTLTTVEDFEALLPWMVKAAATR